MSYTKTNWVDGTAPAISAANLNKIEQGIYDNDQQLDAILSPAPFRIEKFTWESYTYAANASHWVYGDDVHAPTIAGYTPVGVFLSTPSSGGAGLVVQITLQPASFGDRFLGVVRNVTASAITTTLELSILYIKTNLL